MKLAAFLLLLAGWVVVIFALVLLRSAAQRTVFVLAGLGVEILGLVIAMQSHVLPPEERG